MKNRTCPKRLGNPGYASRKNKRPQTKVLWSDFDQWLSLALPRALLRAKTFLPFAVAILFRKPCTFFRCSFFGWYVLFISLHPPFGIGKFARLQNSAVCWNPHGDRRNPFTIYYIVSPWFCQDVSLKKIPFLRLFTNPTVVSVWF